MEGKEWGQWQKEEEEEEWIGCGLRMQRQWRGPVCPESGTDVRKASGGAVSALPALRYVRPDRRRARCPRAGAAWPWSNAWRSRPGLRRVVALSSDWSTRRTEAAIRCGGCPPSAATSVRAAGMLQPPADLNIKTDYSII